MYKLFEFNEINSMNLVNILIQNIYNDIESLNNDIDHIKDVFPFIDNTNVLQSGLSNTGIKITHSLTNDAIYDIRVHDVVETKDYKFVVNQLAIDQLTRNFLLQFF